MKRLLIIFLTAITIGVLSLMATVESAKLMQANESAENKKEFTGNEETDKVEARRRMDERVTFEEERQRDSVIGGGLGVIAGTLLGMWIAALLKNRKRRLASMNLHRNPQWQVPSALGEQPTKSVECNVIETKTHK